MQFFIFRILILDVIGIGFTGIRRDVQFRIKSFQLHASGCHGKKSTGLVRRTGIYMNAVLKHLRITGIHAVHQFAMLAGSFRSQFSVSVLGLSRQSGYDLQRPFPVGCQDTGLIGRLQDCQRFGIFLLLGQITRTVTGKSRNIKGFISLGSRCKYGFRSLIRIILSCSQSRILPDFLTGTLSSCHCSKATQTDHKQCFLFHLLNNLLLKSGNKSRTSPSDEASLHSLKQLTFLKRNRNVILLSQKPEKARRFTLLLHTGNFL